MEIPIDVFVYDATLALFIERESSCSRSRIFAHKSTQWHVTLYFVAIESQERTCWHSSCSFYAYVCVVFLVTFFSVFNYHYRRSKIDWWSSSNIHFQTYFFFRQLKQTQRKHAVVIIWSKHVSAMVSQIHHDFQPINNMFEFIS